MKRIQSSDISPRFAHKSSATFTEYSNTPLSYLMAKDLNRVLTKSSAVVSNLGYAYLGGTRKHLTGYVKFKKKIIYYINLGVI
jgi:hypothetical protein